jgi:hypothetical protein
LNLDPFVAEELVELHKLEILSDRPLFFVEVGIDIIIPSFSALFSDSTW